MPKGNRGRGRKQTAEGAVAQRIQKPNAALPNTTSRPHTRAWVKQEEERTSGQAAAPTAHTAPRSSLRQPLRHRSNAPKDRVPVVRRDRAQPPPTTATQSKHKKIRPGRETLPEKRPAKQAETKAQSKSKPVTKAPAKKKPEGVKAKTGPQGPEFAAWLSRLEPNSPQGLYQTQALFTAKDLSDLDYSAESMDSRSTSRETKDDGSTTAKLTTSKSIKVSEAKLRLRRVSRTATADSRLPYLKSILKTSLPKLALKDIPDLRSVAENFIEQIVNHPNDSCYPYIDEFSFQFDEGKSNINYPVINRQYFEADLERCRARNEAVLQRTIMIHIINQYWLGDIFDWNTEGQWTQTKDTKLPSREDDDISLPRPDLAISFTLRSFTGGEDDSDPIPSDLEKCISPDGGDRCFPFLFFEVKKASSDLQEAYTANLHSASQALYNIYSWMVRAGHEDIFLEEVRLFSIVFNAKDLVVRVHRGEKLSSGALGFRFDEFRVLDRYSKDDACLLVKTILTDYAAKELHPILKATFEEIVKQEDQRVSVKRKADEARGSSKRNRRGQNDIQHTGQSFSMSNLDTQ